MDERKWKHGQAGKETERWREPITSGTAAGAKLDRTKGNQQKAEYLEPGVWMGNQT